MIQWYTPEDALKDDPLDPVPDQDNVKLPYHYAKWKIEPITFIMENDLKFADGNAIKYIMRHRDKNGREDILKAIQYLELILDQEYGGR